MSSEVFTACSVNASVLMKRNFVFFIQIFHHWLMRKEFLSLLITSISIRRLQELVAINKGKDARKICQGGLHCVQNARMNGIMSCSLFVYFCNWIRSGVTKHENLKSYKQTEAQGFGKYGRSECFELCFCIGVTEWVRLRGQNKSTCSLCVSTPLQHALLVSFDPVKLFIFRCCFIHSYFQFV